MALRRKTRKKNRSKRRKSARKSTAQHGAAHLSLEKFATKATFASVFKDKSDLARAKEIQAILMRKGADAQSASRVIKADRGFIREARLSGMSAEQHADHLYKYLEYAVRAEANGDPIVPGMEYRDPEIYAGKRGNASIEKQANREWNDVLRSIRRRKTRPYDPTPEEYRDAERVLF